MTRVFEAKPAVRENVPLLVGIVGPPGAGKTWSGLRLAKGMQQVRPGEVIMIDTDFGRANHYKDYFEFRHVAFDPPFNPEHFGDAVKQYDVPTTAVIVVDTASDEYEGEGGLLDMHDRELERMKDNSWGAWARPKAIQGKMIRTLSRISVPVIYTFRAKEKTKQQVNDRGKKDVVPLGWMPIAPIEFIFAMTVTCILPPNSKGVPAWRSDRMGQDFMIKLPEQFRHLFTEGQELTEANGRALAEWAKGGSSPSATPAAGSAPSPPVDLAALIEEGDHAAEFGPDALQAFGKRLTKDQRVALGAERIAAWKAKAAEVTKVAQTEGADA